MDEKQRKDYEDALHSAGLAPRQADIAPDGQALSESLSWQHGTGFSLMENIGIPVYGYNELQGVVWDCSSCGGVGSLKLRYRKRTYKFHCQSCGRESRYNTLLAQQLLAELGAPEHP